MSLEDLLKQSRIKVINRQKKKDFIRDKLRTSSHPEEIVNQMNIFELEDLDADILKKHVDGYRNFYDYLLQNFEDYKYRPKKEDMNDIELIHTWYLNTHILDKEMLTSDILLSKLPSGETLLDEEIKENSFALYNLKVNTKELAQAIFSKKRYDLLKNSTIDVLRLKINTGESLLEFMLKNKVLPNIKYVNDKTNLFSFNSVPGEDILLEKVRDNATVLDLILKSDFEFNFSLLLDKEKDKELAQAIAKKVVLYDRFELVSNASEWFFMTEIPLGNKKYSLIDFMGTEKVPLPTINGEITEQAIIKKFLTDSNKSMELIKGCSTEILTTEIAKEITPMDVIIYNESKKSKEGKSSNLHSIINHLTDCNKFNRSMSLEFAKYGWYYAPRDEEIELGVNKENSIKKYIYQNRRLPIEEEHLELINRFKETFSGEENSQEIIDTIITSFSHTVYDDKESSIRDIEALIDYKEQYPKFRIQYNPTKGSAFLDGKSTINNDCYLTLNNPNDMYSLTHEWGHLIHEVHDEGKTPDEIKSLIPSDNNFLLSNGVERHNLLSKINEEANELYDEMSIDLEFLKFIEKTKGSPEKYYAEIRQEYINLIGSDTLLIEAVKGKNYSNEVLNALSEAYFDNKKEEYMSEKVISNYVNERIKSEKTALKNEIFRKNNSEFLCYENFIDAYYGGLIGTCMEGSNSKAPASTHNIHYFSLNEERQFMEMFANYTVLIKAPNGQKYIDRLKEKTSPELVTAMDVYYKELGKEKQK